MRDSLLPFCLPSLTERESEELLDTLRSGWLTTGQKTKQFEREFCEYTGAEDALALTSCTAGLHLSLLLAEVGPGDEVITSAMTFAATANTIEHVGGTTVLCDVEPDTLNIDPEDVLRKITPRTRAITVVHYAGHPVELTRLRQIASDYDITLIEDAAHAMGTRLDGVHVGAGENLAAFSFYATKNLTTGEGGMLTGPTELIERARILSLHGLSRNAWRRYQGKQNWAYDVAVPGYKYNMTDLQASLGLWQLRRFDQLQERRAEIYESYQSTFATDPAFRTPVHRGRIDHAYHLYILRVVAERAGFNRDRFVEELADRNISSSVHFIPIYRHSYYAKKYGFDPQDFPHCEAAYSEIISLPLYPALSDQDVTDVIHAVEDIRSSYGQRRAAA